ncbi:MAG: SDR family NAD(P)-dependent oxidoreductase [Micrococcales bacterium]
MDLKGKTVLVVGASGVIGAKLCEKLHAAGASLIATSRNPASEGMLELDLADEASIEALVTRLANVELDGVIIAAGAVAFGTLDAVPIEITNRLMVINATGPISLITKLLANLHGREGFILTISGKIAEIPTTGLAAYSAAKGALYAFAVAASRELRRQGVRWLDARPGHTETGFADRAIFGQAPNFATGLTADAVSERILQGILQDEKDLPSSNFES